MAVQINFVVDQGATFTAIVTIENEDGTLFDLTNMTPLSQMRKSYYTNTSIDIDVEVWGDPLNGEVKIKILPAVSNAIRAGRYVYDIEVHSDLDTEYVKRVVQGIITISPQVTRA